MYKVTVAMRHPVTKELVVSTESVPMLTNSITESTLISNVANNADTTLYSIKLERDGVEIARWRNPNPYA